MPRLALALCLLVIVAGCGESADEASAPQPATATEAQTQAAPKRARLRLRQPRAAAGERARATTQKGAYTVTGRVTPAGAKVVVRNRGTGGQRVATVTGRRFRIRLGLEVGTNRYSLTATAPGYRPARAMLTLRRKEPPPPPPPPEPVEPDCHPSYDPCLKPDSPDYDCAGGSGDGPDYTGPVTVKGDDPYDLDRDGDGSGCD